MNDTLFTRINAPPHLPLPPFSLRAGREGTEEGTERREGEEKATRHAHWFLIVWLRSLNQGSKQTRDSNL